MLTSWKDALLKITNLRSLKCETLRNEYSFIDTTQSDFISVIIFQVDHIFNILKAILWFICCILNEPRFSIDKKPRNQLYPKVPLLQHTFSNHFNGAYFMFFISDLSHCKKTRNPVYCNIYKYRYTLLDHKSPIFTVVKFTCI